MPSIADLFISVSSDVSGAITGLTDVDRKLNGTTQAMQAAAPAGLALAAAAGAVGAGFLDAIGEASDFERQMNGIKAVMSPEEVQIFGGAIEDLAIKLGRDTVFSASQAAEGIEEMIKAGVPLEAILGGAAASALDLAAATGVSVAQAADLASTAMNTYHASAEQLPEIMDTIANVSNATATSVGELQFALAAVGPVAAGIGLDFNDTATALGIFANNGLAGSDAGTSLKTMLLNLTPDTKASTAAFKELGLITADGTNKFFDATGSVRPLNEVFQILKESTAGLTDQMKIQLLQQAFGTDAVRAATIAASEGAAGWDKVAEAMDKMGGTQVAAAQRNQGLAGSLNQLSGSFEAIQITIGQAFLPVLTSMVGALTVVLNAFLTLDPGIQAVIVAIVGITGAVAGAVAAWVLLGPILTAVGAAFGILVAAASPVLAILAAIAIAVAALYLAWQTNFGGIQEVTAEVIAAIQPGLVNLQNFLTLFGSSLAAIFQLLQSGDFQGGIFGLQEDSGFVQFLFAARDGVLQLMAALEPLVAQILAQLPGLIRTLGDLFNWLSGVLQQTGGFWDVLFQIISVNLGAIINVAVLFIDTIRAIFEGDWGRVFSNMVDIFKTIAGAIIQNIAIWLQAIADLLGFGDVWAGFVTGVWELGARVGEALENVFSFIGQAFSGIPELIASLGDLFGPFVNAAWEIGTRLGEAFVNFLGFIGQALSNIPAMIESLGDLWEPFIAGAWNIGTRLGEALMNVFTFIGQLFGEIPNLLMGLGDIFGPIIEAAGALVGRVGAAIEPLRQLLADTFGSFWQFLTGAIELPSGGGQPGGGEGTTVPGTIGTTSPIISIGTLIISSEAEAQAFLDQVAQAVLQSATRVTPPIGGANPALT